MTSRAGTVNGAIGFGARCRGMVHRKPHLPTKTCPVCARPFAWRKKWARDWEAVVYCSERCRRRAK